MTYQGDFPLFPVSEQDPAKASLLIFEVKIKPPLRKHMVRKHEGVERASLKKDRWFIFRGKKTSTLDLK